VKEAVWVLGVRVDVVDLEEATERVLGWVRERRLLNPDRRCPGPDRPRSARMVFTPNPEIVARAARDPEFRAVLRRADLAVPDGVGLVWAVRRRGAPLAERVAGFDLLVSVLERGSREGLRVYLLGSKPGVAEEATQRALSRWPGLEVVGAHHGYFPPDDDAKVAREVVATGAELVAVGMGSPRQELWVARQAGALGGAVAMGVGGSLDVLSGRVRRVPEWLARHGLEWLGRFLSQPARLRRAPALARFVAAVLVEERRMRRELPGRG